MGFTLYYFAKNIDGVRCGLDKHGRWTANIREWETYTDRFKVTQNLSPDAGEYLGIL